MDPTYAAKNSSHPAAKLTKTAPTIQIADHRAYHSLIYAKWFLSTLCGVPWGGGGGLKLYSEQIVKKQQTVTGRGV
ncbi:hypothetical protein BaRGS_00010949, partial [Batillaria attramentaria]